jgi:hypothetical protein
VSDETQSPQDERASLRGLDVVLYDMSKPLKLCGHGKDDNWSIRVHNYFFYNCACCLFFRGIAIGMAIGSIGAACAGYLGYIGGFYGL